MESNILSRALGYMGLARAARKARRATDHTVRANAQRHLAERMGRMHGLPQKIGQILSMGEAPDAPFQPLRQQAEALPIATIRRVLRQAWRRPVDEVCAELDETGHPASLGQVHRAVLHDGREVAIKVQYPGVKRALDNDLRVLGSLSAAVGDLRRGFDLQSYRAEVRRDLLEELDYTKEAANQDEYAVLLREVDGWQVPGVVAEWSTDTVLVSEWCVGAELDEVVQTWTATQQAQLAETMVAGFVHMLFHHGLLHADPHPGNYRFVLDGTTPRILLYDYGSVVRIDEVDRVLLLRLIEESRRSAGQPLDLLAELGFDARLLAPLRARLGGLMHGLLLPFTQPGRFDLSTWNRAERAAELLGDDRWNFRMSGPASLLFLMRAFHGLLFYMEKFDAEVSWSAPLAPLLREHADELESMDWYRGCKQTADQPSRCMAETLRFQVRRGNTVLVQMSYLASELERFAHELDAEVRTTLGQHHVDLDRLVADTIAAEYPPGTLFELAESRDNAGVRLWLE